MVSTGEAIDQDILAPETPPSTSDFQSKVCLNLASTHITSSVSQKTECWSTPLPEVRVLEYL